MARRNPTGMAVMVSDLLLRADHAVPYLECTISGRIAMPSSRRCAIGSMLMGRPT